MNDDDINLYDLIGGDQTIHNLVETFYAKVEADTTLRAIFPQDLEAGKHWQYLFLKQYWGGDTGYSAQRGHPRLRMRHSPYPITPDLGRRWLQYMLEAIDVVAIPDPARSIMRDYFQRAASAMINRFPPQSDDDES